MVGRRKVWRERGKKGGVKGGGGVKRCEGKKRCGGKGDPEGGRSGGKGGKREA